MSCVIVVAGGNIRNVMANELNYCKLLKLNFNSSIIVLL